MRFSPKPRILIISPCRLAKYGEEMNQTLKRTFMAFVSSHYCYVLVAVTEEAS